MGCIVRWLIILGLMGLSSPSMLCQPIGSGYEKSEEQAVKLINKRDKRIIFVIFYGLRVVDKRFKRLFFRKNLVHRANGTC